jgi:arginine repressor
MSFHFTKKYNFSNSSSKNTKKEQKIFLLRKTNFIYSLFHKTAVLIKTGPGAALKLLAGYPFT